MFGCLLLVKYSSFFSLSEETIAVNPSESVCSDLLSIFRIEYRNLAHLRACPYIFPRI